VIADLLTEKGLEVDRRKIQIDEPIKSLGVYDVPIKLHADVEARVKVWVVK
jgi:large subunit ribosomal protein L9